MTEQDTIKNNNEAISECLELAKSYSDLGSILDNKAIIKQDFFLADSGSVTFTSASNSVYLYVNSHISQRCIALFLWGNTNSYRLDVIYKSSDTAVPTYSVSGSTITFTAPGPHRGSLYKLNGAYCL
jgi:hypothetical protein